MNPLKALSLSLSALMISGAFGLEIVKNGKSDFAIYHDSNAPGSVVQGAKELQNYCEKVTGVKLPIVKNVQPHMISLGQNKAAQAAGITADGMALEAYKVAVKDGSVYVLGEDTASGQVCYGGGTSTGTRNGVYALLEECFGVRWLMPGPYGDYYPKKSSITVPDEGFESAPGFLNRRLPYIQEFNEMCKEWGRRQKLGLSLYLSHSHNWVQTIPPKYFDTHPEWFAEHNGVREQPSGDRYKLCISNPELIRKYAEVACEYFAKNPKRSTYSLSPTDSGGWCECANCKKMYETDPEGKRSVTPAVLNFYNEVTKIVRKKYPDRFLGGYVYAEYIYPPKTPIPLADGLVLTLAASFNYSYKLYKEKNQKLTDFMFSEWTKSTKNISYYDLPFTWWRNEMGCINGPALDMMKFVYPRAYANGMKGVYVYGQEAWGHAGVTNYLLARLAWNPNLDVDATFKEYCDCAFGAASPEMQQIYAIVDKATKDYVINANWRDLVPQDGMIKAVYVPLLPEIARLFAEGTAKVKGKSENTAKTLQRLEYFRNNVKILVWNCRQRKLLKEGYGSQIFDSNDDEIASFYDEGVHRIAYYNKPSDMPKIKFNQFNVDKGSAIQRKDASRQTSVLRGTQSIIFKAKSDGELSIAYHPVRSYGAINKLYFYDKDSKLIKWFFLKSGETKKIPAKAGEIYRALLVTAQDFYTLEVKNANWGYVSELGDEGVHFIGNQSREKVATVFFYVPKGTKEFQMWLHGGDSLAETAKSKVITPAGRTITFNCSEQLCDKQTVTVKSGEAGFWRMDTTEGDRSYIDDYFIRIISGIPPVLFTDSENAFKASF